MRRQCTSLKREAGTTLALFLLTLAPLAAPARAQEPAETAPTRILRATKESYQEMLQRVKATDAGVDYKEFRLAYADSPGYQPAANAESRKTMFAALSGKNYEQAAKLAEAILKDRYVDIYAHQVAAVAYRELGDRANSSVHGSVARELMRSIVESGDGSSPESAMVLISEEEEAVILQALALRVAKQELMDNQGHTYDRVDAMDANDITMTIYFNLDVPVIKARQALAAQPK